MKYILLLILLIILLVLKLSGENKNKSYLQENFQVQYDPDYIYNTFYYGDVTMEFDPSELVEGKLPDLNKLFGITPSDSNNISIFPAEEQPPSFNSLPPSIYTTDNKSNNDMFLFPEESLLDKEGKKLQLTKFENTEINNYQEENAGFHDRCYVDNSTYKYRFLSNSSLLGTTFEMLLIFAP